MFQLVRDGETVKLAHNPPFVFPKQGKEAGEDRLVQYVGYVLLLYKKLQSICSVIFLPIKY